MPGVVPGRVVMMCWVVNPAEAEVNLRILREAESKEIVAVSGRKERFSATKNGIPANPLPTTDADSSFVAACFLIARK